MSDTTRIKENIATLKELFVNMSQAIKQLEKQKVILEKDNRTISDVNKSLQESVKRLLSTNEKQQTMLNALDNKDTIKLLKIELNDVKQENLKLKAFFNDGVQNSQQVSEDKSLIDKLENYNSLLQQKIIDLEEQLNQTHNSNFQTLNHDELVSTLKTENKTLLLENKALKGQLSNIQHLYNQQIPKTRLSNLKSDTNEGQQQNLVILPMAVDETDQDELHPLWVSVIDDDE